MPPAWREMYRLTPNGLPSRSYYLEYRNAEGRRLRYRIGGYPGLDPDQARKLGKIAAGDVASGIDVQARKKERRNDHELARRQTLRVFVNEQYEPWQSRISSLPCR